jgi:hypothetical protein
MTSSPSTRALPLLGGGYMIKLRNSLILAAAAGSRPAVPQRLRLMHLWLQQALLYCCCLPSLVFPRDPSAQPQCR